MDDEIVTLLSSDSEEFKVRRAVAEQSEAIRCILAETSIDSPVPLMNVRATILRKVVEFCQFEVDANVKDGEKGTKTTEEVGFSIASPQLHRGGCVWRTSRQL
jgi:Skp1 family, tetramerisation domain